MVKDYQDISDYYDDIESNYKIWVENPDFEESLQKLKVKSTKDEYPRIDWEKAVLAISIRKGEITTGTNPYGYPSYDLFKNGGYSYLEKRTKEINNLSLITRYNHILWGGKEKKQQYAKSAIDGYISLFESLVLKDSHCDGYIVDLIKNGSVISSNINYRNSKFIELCKEFLFNEKIREVSEVSPFVEFLLTQKWFKTHDFNGVIERLCNISDNYKENQKFFYSKSVLETCLRVAKKINSNKKKMVTIKLGLCCEAISDHRKDDLTGMIQLSFLADAMNYFDSIAEKQHSDRVGVKLQNAKTKLKLGTFEYEFNAKEIVTPWRSQLTFLLEKDSKYIFDFLAHNINLFPNEYEMSNHVDSFMEHCVKTSFDLNNNIGFLNDDMTSVFDSKTMYAFELSLYVKTFLFELFTTGYSLGLVNYSNIIRYLEKTSAFGVELEINRQGESLKFTWIDLLQPAIFEFFKQFEIYQITQKMNFILVLDSLTLKFEGLLRDLASMWGIPIVTSYRKGKKKETRQVFIEDLLSNEKMIQILVQQDRLLFEYLFTKSGMNIRNNIAHSFYKPQDYDVNKALLLFLALLRLSKYKMDISK